MAADWRAERARGMRAITLASGVTLALWLALWQWGPGFDGSWDLGARAVLAIKCLAVAALFTLVAGVEAVAHERLQSPAFDPLPGQDSHRLRVNQRYLQNTLEQFAIFATAVAGLAVYADTPSALRALLATVVVWVLGRWAFWIGYHRAVALRGLGMPGMIAAMLALLYVAARVGHDGAGRVGALGLVLAFLGLEALLFARTRGQ